MIYVLSGISTQFKFKWKALKITIKYKLTILIVYIIIIHFKFLTRNVKQEAQMACIAT